MKKTADEKLVTIATVHAAQGVRFNPGSGKGRGNFGE